MNSYLKWAALGFVVLATAVGCKSEPQQVAPAKAGERNSSCRAKNDCADGLSCIFGRCTPTDFSFESSGKECSITQCEATADCCGDNPTEAPAKCAEQGSKCVPSLPGCDVVTCDSAADCDGGGTCGGTRYCSASFDLCSDLNPCEQDTCDLGFCSVSGGACTTAADCTAVNTCGSGYCDCSNPEYSPSDPICDDPDCDSLCVLKCEERLCVLDESCETDTDCFGLPGDTCVDGVCVECEANDECDEDNGESCVEGFCDKPCEFDQECSQFEVCEAGECVYQGCQSDNECALDPQAAITVPEPRLLKCVPGSDGFNACRLPCEADAHCSDNTQVCANGFCQDIGCQTNEECDNTIPGLKDQVVTKERPYVTKGVCEAVVPAAAE